MRAYVTVYPGECYTTENSCNNLSSCKMSLQLLQLFYGSLDFVWDYLGEPVTRKITLGRQNQSGFTGAKDSEWQ